MGHKTIIHRTALILLLCGAVLGSPPRTQEPSSMDQVLNEIVAREQGFMLRLQQYRPLVETYLQSVKPNGMLGSVPVRDRYFLARLELAEQPAPAKREKAKPEKAKRDKDKKDKKISSDTPSKPSTNGKLLEMYHYSVASNPDGFARMLTLDATTFDRDHYRFEFVRREFLGEVRTLVFDVSPKKVKGAKPGRFTGRIWVEDQGYNIVRYNGVYGSIFSTNLHFDSWRVSAGPGLWLPAYVYTEEPDRPGGDPKVKYKGQTRIWGYDVKRRSSDEAFTKVLIDAPMTHDESESPGQISPVESFRAWEREAEDNVLQRLERAGLLAPEGEVSKILETVVANLELTNDLEIYPPVRCRVLLTTPLESFTIGRTIVLSRGLIDVLPDEASLALVLAHELGHVLSGHLLDTKYAFSDHMLVTDKQTLEQFQFERDPEEEREADEKAVELMRNSPYKDDLTAAGLFLKALAANSESLATLIQPHFGNRLAVKERYTRLARIIDGSPELDPTALDQIAALPLGGRVKVDPWTARVELMKTQRVALLSPREKMPFQVTPLMPYLVRFDARAENNDAIHEAKSPAGAPARNAPQAGAEEGFSETVAADRVRDESR